MKFHTLSRRAAAAGAASALVAGALVATTTTAAQAAPTSATYTCGITGLAGPWDVTLATELPGIEAFPVIPAGTDIGAGLLTVTNTFTIPAEAFTALGSFGVTNVTFPDYAGVFGRSSVGVDGMGANVADMVNNGDGTYSFAANGLNQAFSVPAAGNYVIETPATFNMNANNADGLIAPVPCALKDGTEPGTYHTVQVTKNASTTTAKAKDATVKKRDGAKVVVKVAAPNQRPSGTVVLKRGAKTLAKGKLQRGKVVVKVAPKKLKIGKNKLVVTYKGDGYTKGSKSKAFVVKVRR